MACSSTSSGSLCASNPSFSSRIRKNGHSAATKASSLSFCSRASFHGSISSQRRLRRYCRPIPLHMENEVEQLHRDENEDGGALTELVGAATNDKGRRSPASEEERKCPRPGVVSVQPRPRKGLVSALVDLLERAAVYFVHDTSKPNYYLTGNYAPVGKETPPVTNLTVRGSLPECLNGEFFRVGPNPKFIPVAGYHWFDGDGMIHGLRIKDGSLTYVSRYVRTSKLVQEEYLGSAKFIKVGDLKGKFGLFMYLMQFLREKLKVLDFSYGKGTGNVALTYHHGRLLALREDDKPYVIEVLEDGDLQTVGMLDYDRRLSQSFSAHPKIDPITNEMFTFGCSYMPPYITYHVISKDGVMLNQVPITIQEPIMLHDFSITENYAIFMDLPLYLRPKELVKGKSLYNFNHTDKTHFGILPRYAKDGLSIKWFEQPNCFIFHNANAWEEGDEVVLITCRLEFPDLPIASGGPVDQQKNKTNQLYEMRFNLKTGAATQKKLSAAAVDFPRINESYIGRKQRYVYCSVLDEAEKTKAIVKFDLNAKPQAGKKQIEVGGNVKGIFDLGPGRFGSEAIFVPSRPGINFEEDDGYLIFFVHNECTGKSEANVIDAKTMSPDPVAVVDLPSRIPYGFHSLFVSEEQLNDRHKYDHSTIKEPRISTTGII